MANETTRQGNVITNPPRAVMVRVPGALHDDPHSAIVANLTILTENRKEVDAIMGGWDHIADAINETVLRLINPTEPTKE